MSNRDQYEFLRYFNYKHLPDNLKETSQLFHDLAHVLDSEILPGKQKEKGMQKLLEAKDCFVRANLS